MIEERLPGLALRRDLGEPDGGLDGFDLAEEGPCLAEAMVAPVLQQARRLGRDAPGVLIGQPPPVIDLLGDRSKRTP
jgi:hypothetical protein